MNGLIPATRSLQKSRRLLKTEYVKELKRYPVSKLVNRVGNNSKECMEPLKEAKA